MMDFVGLVAWIMICIPAICLFEFGVFIVGKKARLAARQKYVEFQIKRIGAELPAPKSRAGTKPPKRKKARK